MDTGSIHPPRPPESQERGDSSAVPKVSPLRIPIPENIPIGQFLTLMLQATSPLPPDLPEAIRREMTAQREQVAALHPLQALREGKRNVVGTLTRYDYPSGSGIFYYCKDFTLDYSGVVFCYRLYSDRKFAGNESQKARFSELVNQEDRGTLNEAESAELKELRRTIGFSEKIADMELSAASTAIIEEAEQELLGEASTSDRVSAKAREILMAKLFSTKVTVESGSTPSSFKVILSAEHKIFKEIPIRRIDTVYQRFADGMEMEITSELPPSSKNFWLALEPSGDLEKAKSHVQAHWYEAASQLQFEIDWCVGGCRSLLEEIEGWQNTVRQISHLKHKIVALNRGLSKNYLCRPPRSKSKEKSEALGALKAELDKFASEKEEREKYAQLTAARVALQKRVALLREMTQGEAEGSEVHELSASQRLSLERAERLLSSNAMQDLGALLEEADLLQIEGEAIEERWHASYEEAMSQELIRPLSTLKERLERGGLSSEEWADAKTRLKELDRHPLLVNQALWQALKRRESALCQQVERLIDRCRELSVKNGSHH